MAIQWSARQSSECTWFVSISGFDTVAAWNNYLGTVVVTTGNIGSSLYPYRTWQAVVADSRSMSGQKVAVGLGKWGAECQRTVWTKSMYWLGMTGTVIDMLSCSKYVLSTSANDIMDTASFVNCESRAPFFLYSLSLKLYNIHIDAFNAAYADNETGGCLISHCVIDSFVNTRRSSLTAVNSTLFGDLDGKCNGTFVSCILPRSSVYISAYNCCYTESGNTLNSCLVADPLFNNAAIGDYTLSPASPCLYRGKNGVHIGAFGEARTINPNSPELADGTAIYSLTGGLTDLVKTSYDVGGVTMYMLSLRTGKTSGTVETGWIDFGRTRDVDSLRFVADMIYSAGGNYAQAPSPDLNMLSVSYKAALTEAEKAGAAWVSTEWGAEDLAVSARYIKLLITVTSTTPAP